ncbi:MAG: hypothetical protein IJ383_00970 [Bacteroidales bacterium]|nr:hypothetical protein [Bacteroidales bacterium]
MNIFTVPYSSRHFYCRPDTSLNRDSNDYFCPDGVNRLAAAVFIYVRASKAGKSVSSKFAGRYYTTAGTGVQFYAPELEDACSHESWWISRSLDNSTFLLGDEHPAEELPEVIKEKINAAFETVSRHVSFRTGDYVAIEIEPPITVPETECTFTINGKVLNIIR